MLQRLRQRDKYIMLHFIMPSFLTELSIRYYSHSLNPPQSGSMYTTRCCQHKRGKIRESLVDLTPHYSLVNIIYTQTVMNSYWCLGLFIRRILVASNAIQTIVNEMVNIISILFKLHSTRLKCYVSVKQTLERY